MTWVCTIHPGFLSDYLCSKLQNIYHRKNVESNLKERKEKAKGGEGIQVYKCISSHLKGHNKADRLANLEVCQ